VEQAAKVPLLELVACNVRGKQFGAGEIFDGALPVNIVAIWVLNKGVGGRWCVKGRLRSTRMQEFSVGNFPGNF